MGNTQQSEKSQNKNYQEELKKCQKEFEELKKFGQKIKETNELIRSTFDEIVNMIEYTDPMFKNNFKNIVFEFCENRFISNLSIFYGRCKFYIKEINMSIYYDAYYTSNPVYYTGNTGNTANCIKNKNEIIFTFNHENEHIIFDLINNEYIECKLYQKITTNMKSKNHLK